MVGPEKKRGRALGKETAKRGNRRREEEVRGRWGKGGKESAREQGGAVGGEKVPTEARGNTTTARCWWRPDNRSRCGADAVTVCPRQFKGAGKVTSPK